MVRNLNWFDYWNQKDTFMLEDMKKNKEIFLRNSAGFLPFNKEDVVLDIGCGPGYLEEYLKDKVREVHCLETSENFLKVLKKKFDKFSNISIYKLNRKDYTNLNFLRSKRFTVALCIGVVPYYKNIDDFIRLIREVQKLCKGGLFLIADIKVKENIFIDVFSLLKMGFKENHFIKSLSFLIKARLSSYYSAYRNRGLLVIPESRIKEIVKELNLTAKILDIPLTLNSERKHLLIRFSS